MLFDPVTRGLRTFLTFRGGAATRALDLYRDVFDDFELLEIDHYGADDVGLSAPCDRHGSGRPGTT